MIKVNGDKFTVVGGAGFIGSHIVEELTHQKKEVVLIDNFVSGKNLHTIINDYTTVYGSDITDESDPIISEFDATLKNSNVVFHEACSKCTVCRDDPFKDLMTNAWGSFRVFDAARKAGAKVVHASTGSVYGDNSSNERYDRSAGGILIPVLPVEENTQYAPKSFYGVSKLAGEQYLRAFNEYYGLRFVGLRYFHVFGPRQDAGPNGGVVAIFITNMLKGEPITIFGDGNQTRSFTYVKDVVNANFHAANSKEMEGNYFNVASGISVSLNQLVEVLSEIMDVKPTVEYKPVRLGDIKDFNVSNDLIGRHGFSAWSEFKDALTETVGWYRGNTQT